MTPLLILIILALGSIIGLLIYQIASIKEQLNLIIREKKTNKLVTVTFHGLKIDQLVIEINNLINSHILKEQELEYEKTRLKSQVTSISHDLRTPLTAMSYYNELEDNGIKLDLIIEEDMEILGNQNALARVYSNLLSNIKKHGCEYATIHHSIQNHQLTTTITNKIKPQATLEEDRLFEKFYTGEKSRHQTSSGIGMYSSKIMLEKMNHKITAKIHKGNMIITIIYN